MDLISCELNLIHICTCVYSKSSVLCFLSSSISVLKTFLAKCMYRTTTVALILLKIKKTTSIQLYMFGKTGGFFYDMFCRDGHFWKGFVLELSVISEWVCSWRSEMLLLCVYVCVCVCACMYLCIYACRYGLCTICFKIIHQAINAHNQQIDGSLHLTNQCSHM